MMIEKEGMNMQSYTVAIDLDGVMWDLITPWLEQYNRFTNENVTIDQIKSYHISEYVNHEEILYYILESASFWENIKPYEGARDAIQMLKEQSEIDLVIATNTCYKIASAKINHMLELFPEIQPDEVILTKRKDLLNVDFLIDDYENNLRQTLVRHRIPVLIDQPYNRHFANNTYGIIRKSNLLEAAQMIVHYLEHNDMENKSLTHTSQKGAIN